MVMSLSGGALGGVRAQAHLKYILNGMLAEVPPVMEGRPQGARVPARFHDEVVMDFVAKAVRDCFRRGACQRPSLG